MLSSEAAYCLQVLLRHSCQCSAHLLLLYLIFLIMYTLLRTASRSFFCLSHLYAERFETLHCVKRTKVRTTQLQLQAEGSTRRNVAVK